VISDLDESLRRFLVQRMPLDQTVVDVSFEMPDRAWVASIAKPTINVYLYDIRENQDLRNNDWMVTHQDGRVTKKKPPVRIDLSYLITVWTSDTGDQHRLLGQLMATLFRYPVLPDEILAGKLQGLEWPVRALTAQADGVLRNCADFWSAIDNQLKPSINYVVTIPVDLEVALTVPEVRTKVIGLRRSDGDGNGLEQSIEIAGTLHRKGNPVRTLPGATILVRELQMTANTDDKGRFTLGKLGFGSYTFEVVVPGEKRRRVAVIVPSGSYDIGL
jgi:hypothetical protein